METNEFAFRPYMLKELTKLYCCSAKTFRNWLKNIEHELGPRIGYYYSVRQVRIILNHLGAPVVDKLYLAAFAASACWVR